ncbi:uncharacterized protein V6R79_021814 [Siganus canaliculatus]
MLRWVLLALFFGVCAAAGEQKQKKDKPRPFSRGWGTDISWVKTYEQALTKMRNSRKPLMVIYHKEGCQFSQELKKAFSAHKYVQKIAKEDFIMVNVLEETENQDHLAPDGFYVPRIIFVDQLGGVRRDIIGKYSNRQYAYEPGDMAHLVKNMRKAKVPLRTEL